MRLLPIGIAAVVVLLAAVGGGRSDRSSPRATDVPAAQAVQSKRGNVQRFRSLPGLRPPTVRVRKRARGVAPGHVFVAPFNGPGQDGPMILDNRGELVWFHPLRRKVATAFRVQTYRGRPVLTWWEGRPVRGWGDGQYVIADSSYREVARIRAGAGFDGDLHEFVIGPQGTALVTTYEPVRRDLRSLGGARRATVMDGVLQEIDIESGRVLFQWRSLDHVQPAESYKQVPHRAGDPWDYFHINSIDVDTDGNLLVGARNTHAVYKVSHATGAIIWRLNGKRSDFRMGRGTRFAWQHDARRQSDGTITVFDNGASPKVRSQSRGLALKVDVGRGRVTLGRQYRHPRRLLAPNKANMQMLPGGDVFIGWGAEPYFSEFTERGRLIFDARFPKQVDSYRAYRFGWSAAPTGEPALAARVRGGRVTVYASWNGATAVARWEVLAGEAADSLRGVRSASRRGFETAISVPAGDRYFAVRALDRAGHVLGTSRAVTAGR